MGTSTYGYDSLARLTSLDHKKSTTDIANYDWTYDTLNRVATFVSPDGTATYKYDATSQLASVDNTVLADEAYVNDLNGNRASKGTTNTTTGDNNRLTSDGTYNYEYDAEGNRTRRVKISDNTSTEYDWDYRSRLTEVREKNASSTVTKRVTNVYDVYDRRIGKVIDPDGDTGSAATNTTRYVYDLPDEQGLSNIALTYNGSSALKNRYLHGPAVDQILADEDSTNSVLWPLADNLGTVRDLVNSSGTVQNHIKYDAYGNVLAESNSAIDSIFGYTGREKEEDTGLMYYRARYYDPAVGKFLSEDPLGFAAGDSNLSRYVANSTTNATDPSGLNTVVAGTIGGVGGAGWAGVQKLYGAYWNWINPGPQPTQHQAHYDPAPAVTPPAAGPAMGLLAMIQAYGAIDDKSSTGGRFSANYASDQRQRDEYRWWHGVVSTNWYISPIVVPSYIAPWSNPPGAHWGWAAAKWTAWIIATIASAGAAAAAAPAVAASASAAASSTGTAIAAWWTSLGGVGWTFGGCSFAGIPVSAGITITAQQVVVGGALAVSAVSTLLLSNVLSSTSIMVGAGNGPTGVSVVGQGPMTEAETALVQALYSFTTSPNKPLIWHLHHLFPKAIKAILKGQIPSININKFLTPVNRLLHQLWLIRINLQHSSGRIVL